MKDRLELADEAFAAVVAGVMGESSASAMALAELKRRRDAGENVALYRSRRSLVVGPTYPPSPALPNDPEATTSIP